MNTPLVGRKAEQNRRFFSPLGETRKHADCYITYLTENYPYG